MATQSKTAATQTKPVGDTQPTFPIGSVVAYAGNLAIPAHLETIQAAGWLLCDGASYNSADYPDLYRAIGKVNGGNTSGDFNVPDLRNRFVRGWNGAAVQPDSGTTIDPDASTRIAAASGGATGNAVGSLQKTATALPINQFVLARSGDHHHTVKHLNDDRHQAWKGLGATMARGHATASTEFAGNHHHILSGYDATTAPVNMALYYIIKAKQPKTQDGQIPASAIAGFAGSVAIPPAGWLRCDGMPYSASAYPALIQMISSNYGGDGTSVFNVPDLRGNFIRATSHSTTRDPDASSRHSQNAGGNTGANTGSAQGYATMKSAQLKVATAGDHSHDISNVPQTDHNAAKGASGPLARYCMVWTDHTTQSEDGGTHTHTVTGGDKETRPENIYLDQFIASDNRSINAPPIGSIMAAGCDTNNLSNSAPLYEAGWLACDGRSLDNNDKNFTALFAAIGNIYGGDNHSFNLPDLRGYFVLGASKQRGVASKGASTTGTPQNALVTSTDGSHRHDMPNVPTSTSKIDVAVGWDLAENDSGTSSTSTDGAHTHELSGGDKESRCINVYADYIIRFK